LIIARLLKQEQYELFNFKGATSNLPHNQRPVRTICKVFQTIIKLSTNKLTTEFSTFGFLRLQAKRERFLEKNQLLASFLFLQSKLASEMIYCVNSELATAERHRTFPA
jgi:hypothetical protein